MSTINDPPTAAPDGPGPSDAPPRFTLKGAPTLGLSSQDLHYIVLDYLTHSTHVDSAVAFVRDWQSSDRASRPSATSITSSSSAGTLEPSHVAAGGPPHKQARQDSNRVQHTSSSVSRRSSAGADVHMNGDIGDVPRNGHLDPALDAPTVSATNRAGSLSHAILSEDEIRTIRVRKDIKRLIQQGTIQAAIELCHMHFPGVLATPSTSQSSAPSSDVHRTPTSSNRFSASSTPRPSSHYATSKGPAGPSSVPSTASAASQNAPTYKQDNVTFSTSPLLLSLAMQIQLFIEIVRTSSSLQQTNQISRPSTPFSNGQSPGSANGSMEGSTSSLASLGSAASSGAMSYSTNGSTGSTSMLSAALGHIQSLHAQANALQDSNTRTMYLKELESVSGLLPYHDPKLSPVAYYLDEKRRDTLAEAVNGAILLSLGRGSVHPKLLQCVQQNDLVWKTLHELKAVYPEKGSSKAKPPKPILAFSMEEFLNTTSIPDA